MTTLLHLLLWTLLSVAALTTALTLTARWAWRRTRKALTFRIDRLKRSPRAHPALPSGAGHSRSLAGAAGSAAASLTASARIRAVAAVPGPARQAAVIRRDLRADLTGAQRAVSTGRRAGRPIQSLDSIMQGLHEHARDLDVDLALIASEPDRRTRQQLLAAQHERVQFLRQACRQVRRVVQLAGSAIPAPLLRSLIDELNDEVTALSLKARAYAELTGA